MDLKKAFGSGGGGLTPNDSAGQPSLRDLLALIASAVAAVPAWSAALTVTTHVVTLATKGWVVGVDATTATAAGGKIIQSQATPAAGAVQVEYDANGLPTLTFEATDAVTACKVQQLVLSDTITVEA